jgi:hypothetical protein
MAVIDGINDLGVVDAALPRLGCQEPAQSPREQKRSFRRDARRACQRYSGADLPYRLAWNAIG